MKSDKIAKFMALGGQKRSAHFDQGSPEQRELGAQLLLSEVLEYVVHGLGVVPIVNGTKITEPNQLHYKVAADPNHEEMLDGLADVAYTMYWNALAFGLPLEEAFELVCDNNLHKFVEVPVATFKAGPVERELWHLGQGISWPNEVTQVEVIQYQSGLFAVGKDKNGKVRKPSSYQPVNLKPLICSPR